MKRRARLLNGRLDRGGLSRSLLNTSVEANLAKSDDLFRWKWLAIERFASTAPNPRATRRRTAIFEHLETKRLMAATTIPEPVLSPDEVSTILSRAAAATASNNAIIAVVDRQGQPLGIRVESGVSASIMGNVQTKVFAIDGALAEARTGAFFGNDQAPLTSRTIQEISQSTMTQREIQSNPNINDPNSPLQGPGFVAPIGEKGHFPARVSYTPQVDLFQIEHTNRDGLVKAGPDRVLGTPDDLPLTGRFNIDQAYVPPGQSLPPPVSYGVSSGLLPTAQSRGIGTLPGGIPIVENNFVVGGIGVFFPGTTGYATEENSSLNDAGFFDPNKPDLAAEAEYIAFVAVGGSKKAAASFNTPAKNKALGLPPLPPSFDLPAGRIDLVGITLDLFGGHGRQGPANLVALGKTLGRGDQKDGLPNQHLNPKGDMLLPGTTPPVGWLVTPHGSADGTLTADDVQNIINNGIIAANKTRSAIRLPLDSTAKMMLSVTDKNGNVLGLFRMPDATYFSIDVAVAKARNVTYYADPAKLQTIDKVGNLPSGVAMTNRTFRFLAEPRFPEGIDGNSPGRFSILNETGVRQSGPRLPASAFQTAQGYDSFNPQTNFHDPTNPMNQNGVVFFPGSAPLYKTINGQRALVGGLGVSGDGVDQDDVVTTQAAKGFEPPNSLRADQFFVRGVRLPYQKFNRQPIEPLGEPKLPLLTLQPIRAINRPTGLTPREVRQINTYRVQSIAKAK